MQRFAARVQPSSKRNRLYSMLQTSHVPDAEREQFAVDRLSKLSKVHGTEVVALQRVIGNRATERLLRQKAVGEHTESGSSPCISIESVPADVVQLVRIEGVPAVKSQWKKKGPVATGVDLNCGWYCLMSALEYSINKLGLTHLDAPEVLAPKRTKRAYAPHEDAIEFVTKIDEEPKDIEGWDSILSEHGPLMVARDLAIPVIGHFVLIVGFDTETNKVEFFDPLSAGKSHFISFKKFQKVYRPGRTSYVNEDALIKKDKLNKIVAESKERQSMKDEKETKENTKGEKEIEESSSEED